MMDAQLTAALAADLDTAFEGVVLAHQDRLYSIALRLLGDPGDAEEVAQDAFVRAYRALSAWDPQRIRELQLRGWLATIVINLARNRTRRRKPAMVRLDPTGDEATSPASTVRATDRQGSPHDVAIHREAAGRWAALLRELPDRYRTPIVLRHVDGLSYDEMARALGRPEGTIKAQVHRGLALLRSAFLAAERDTRGEMTA